MVFSFAEETSMDYYCEKRSQCGLFACLFRNLKKNDCLGPRKWWLAFVTSKKKKENLLFCINKKEGKMIKADRLSSLTKISLDKALKTYHVVITSEFSKL